MLKIFDDLLRESGGEELGENVVHYFRVLFTTSAAAISGMMSVTHHADRCVLSAAHGPDLPRLLVLALLRAQEATGTSAVSRSL